MSFGRTHQISDVVFRSSHGLSLHEAPLATGGEQGTPLEPRPLHWLWSILLSCELEQLPLLVLQLPYPLRVAMTHQLCDHAGQWSARKVEGTIRLTLITQCLPDVSSSSSDTGTSDIISPFPRKHHHLQQHASHWLETPSPGPTRPNSPSSAHSRSKSISTFASLYTDEHRSSIRHSVQRSNLARRWVRWMDKNGMKHWVVQCSVLVAVGIKWATGLGSYSGMEDIVTRRAQNL